MFGLLIYLPFHLRHTDFQPFDFRPLHSLLFYFSAFQIFGLLMHSAHPVIFACIFAEKGPILFNDTIITNKYSWFICDNKQGKIKHNFDGQTFRHLDQGFPLRQNKHLFNPQLFIQTENMVKRKCENDVNFSEKVRMVLYNNNVEQRTRQSYKSAS